MKRSKWLKAVSMTMAAVLTLGLAGCGNGGDKGGDQQTPAANANKTYQIGVVQLVEHAALDNANKGFVDGLAAAGFVAGENVTFDQQNAQADQSNLQNIAQRFVSNDVDLICAIATPAAQTVANATTDIPIVGTAITDYAAANLVESNETPGTNVTGTSDMNPITDQVDLMLKIKPEAKVIGTIYCSSETNSEIQVAQMEEYAATLDLTVEKATVSNVNDIQQAAQSLVSKGIDALYAPTDNVLSSSMPTLIGVTDEAKIPVICGEASQVEQGGLATVGIDYYELGLQTGAMAAKILKGEGLPAEMAIESPSEYAVAINTDAAERLGIEIPADLLDKAQIFSAETASGE